MLKLRKLLKKVIKAIIPYGISWGLVKSKERKRFFFEVQLADHCNLNCIGCSHFSPVSDTHLLDVDNYKKDCKRFSELAKNNVSKIHLMGGEPLLHNRVSDILKITRDNFKNCIIKIVTNGILLDRMGDDFWNNCKLNNIIIAITPYPININVKKICELAEQFNVVVEIFGNQYKMKFRKDVYDTKGLQNKNISFKKCGKSSCHHLYNGKFYMCPSPAYIKYINRFFQKDFNVQTDDYIDIYDVRNIKQILKYLRKPIPFCRYCNIDANAHDVTWRISKKEISEWI